jgi:3-oxoacyl-[acyl-carrier protein] reductase
MSTDNASAAKPLEGKVTIITGGGRGIGRATAQVFAQRGAKLVLVDRDLEQAEEVAAELRNAGAVALALSAEVTDSASTKAMAERVTSEFGRIDVLVNNAGITRDNLLMRMSEEEWDAVIDINLKGAFNCCKAVIRQMMKQHSGRIVNISSVSGIIGQVGQVNYSSSKAGLIGLTKALAREVASRHITVNAVAPGFVPTRLTNDLPDELKQQMLKLIPLSRWAQPEEIAYAVAFLASEDAAYITGQVLAVDGGLTMA